MTALGAAYMMVAALFSLMAFRAFRSASTSDYCLGALQCFGLLLLLSQYQQWALCILLISAGVYLISQILTGARVISRLLPLVGALAVLLALLLS
jgi:hypothetical protein